MKVKEIIEQEFDLRLQNTVIACLLDKGIDCCKSITEDDIKNVKGNGIMTQEVCQAIVRSAMRIAKECSVFDDVIPFIIQECPNKGINWQRMNEIAGKAIDGLIEDGMYNAYEYFKSEMDLDESEAEWFGISDLYDDEEE